MKCDVWDELADDDTINNLVLTLNGKKLNMSTGSDFSPGGTIYNLVGRDGCSDTTDTIQDGTFDAAQL